MFLMVKHSELNPDDLAILLTGSTRVVSDRLMDAVAAADIEGMRPSFGFAIRALAESDRSPGQLAELLGVTKQRATQLADEMEKAGFIERTPDPGDRRRTLLSLTEQGSAVRRAALGESRRIERELREKLGDRAVDGLRRSLRALLEAAGEDAAAMAGRSRALW